MCAVRDRLENGKGRRDTVEREGIGTVALIDLLGAMSQME